MEPPNLVCSDDTLEIDLTAESDDNYFEKHDSLFEAHDHVIKEEFPDIDLTNMENSEEIYCVDLTSPKKDKEHLKNESEGFIGAATDITNISDAFSLFFDEYVINLIVDATNENINRTTTPNETYASEIKAVLGLFILHGTLNAYLKIKELYMHKNKNILIFKETMTKDRFNFLLENLSFCTVKNRANEDEYEKCQHLVEYVTNKFCKYFIPSQYLTVDILHELSGKNCEIYTLVDPKYLFNINIKLITRSHDESCNEKIIEQDLLNLVMPIKNTKRNATINNIRMNATTICKLYDKYDLTSIVPIDASDAELFSKFASPREFILLPIKTVDSRYSHIITTMHKAHNVPKPVPDSILDIYSKTRNAVYYFRKCSTPTINIHKCSLPISILLHLIDLCITNANTIYNFNPNVHVNRNEFLLQLSDCLRRPYIDVLQHSGNNIKRKKKKKSNQVLNELQHDINKLEKKIKKLKKRQNSVSEKQ